MNGLRKIVLADLARGIRLMVHVQDEIDPQLRFATPEGDVALIIMLPDDDRGRAAMLGRLRRFCALKQAIAFTMTVNIEKPEAVMTIGVSRDGVLCCMSEIKGKKGFYTEEEFAHPVWLSREAVGQDITAILSWGPTELSEAELTELEEWFGEDGRFPAVNLAYEAAGRPVRPN